MKTVLKGSLVLNLIIQHRTIQLHQLVTHLKNVYNRNQNICDSDFHSHWFKGPLIKRKKYEADVCNSSRSTLICHRSF